MTDTDVRNFYVQNSERMQGRSFEQMSAGHPAVSSRSSSRRPRSQELIAELRKAGPAIRVVMDVPRTTVAVAADDPSEGKARRPGDRRRVLRLPVSVLPARDADAEGASREVRRQDALVWKDFPLTQIHPQAFVAAQAGNCAREQGKFWEYHDRLFANQSALQPEFLKKYAADAGLDAAKFNAVPR